MCGIAGIIGPGASSAIAEIMSEKIKHRGPDGNGEWHSDGIALAHRRLAIIDLESGQQPMVSNSGRWVLVYNGEVYNYRDLRASELSGYSFKTSSDTEVVLAALERWGDAACGKLQGMFAFAAYDTHERRLLLARDPQGIKPVYYARKRNKAAIFASEVKALIAGGIGVSVDEDALEIFLNMRFVPSPYTLFNGVKKLRPGHFVWIESDGSISDQTPFSFIAPPVDRTLTDKQCIDQLREKFEFAVRRQLISDVPIGVLLSGGVDSAGVAAFAVKAQPGIATYCIGYSSSHWSNEFKEARRTASYLKTSHTEIRIDENDAIQCMGSLIYHLEEPLVTPSMFSYYLLCKEVSKYRKVVLSGQGVDEPWGGYRRHRMLALKSRISPFIRIAPESFLELLLSKDLSSRAKSLVSADLETDNWLSLHSIFSKEQRDAIRSNSNTTYDLTKKLMQYVCGFLPKDSSPLERLLTFETRTSLPDNLLIIGDKLSMAWGLEVRVPYLDPYYLNMVEALPGKMKIGGMTCQKQKLSHKRMFKTILPGEVMRRPKKGFQTPIEMWLKGRLGEMLRDTVMSRDSFSRKYLNVDAIDNIICEHQQGGRGNLERQLFSIWVLEEWHRVFHGNMPLSSYSGNLKKRSPKKILCVSNMFPSKQFPYFGIFVKGVCNILTGMGFKVDTVAIGRTNWSVLKFLKYAKFIFHVSIKGFFGHYDTVYLHYPSHTAFPIVFIAKLRNKKIIINYHGNDGWHDGVFYWINQKAIRIANKIIFPSVFFKNQMEKRFNILEGKCFVSPSGGVNTNLFQPLKNKLSGNPEMPVIGYVSELSLEKGIFVFLKALAKLGDFRFSAVVIGQGTINDEIKHFISKNNLESRVKLIGPVAQNKLAPYYQSFDVFIFPSLRTKEESLGLVGVEALACGVPVIGSDIPGIMEYVQDGVDGFLFRKGDSEDLSKKMTKYFQLGASERLSLSQNAVAVIRQRYSREQVAKHLYDLFVAD